jgi:hypothetical protein
MDEFDELIRMNGIWPDPVPVEESTLSPDEISPLAEFQSDGVNEEGPHQAEETQASHVIASPTLYGPKLWAPTGPHYDAGTPCGDNLIALITNIPCMARFDGCPHLHANFHVTSAEHFPGFKELFKTSPSGLCVCAHCLMQAHTEHGVPTPLTGKTYGDLKVTALKKMEKDDRTFNGRLYVPKEALQGLTPEQFAEQIVSWRIKGKGKAWKKASMVYVGVFPSGLHKGQHVMLVRGEGAASIPALLSTGGGPKRGKKRKERVAAQKMHIKIAGMEWTAENGTDIQKHLRTDNKRKGLYGKEGKPMFQNKGWEVEHIARTFVPAAPLPETSMADVQARNAQLEKQNSELRLENQRLQNGKEHAAQMRLNEKVMRENAELKELIREMKYYESRGTLLKLQGEHSDLKEEALRLKIENERVMDLNKRLYRIIGSLKKTSSDFHDPVIATKRQRCY